MQREHIGEADLGAIPAFGKLLISRDMSRPLDHAAALKECKRLANLWLDSSDAQIPGTSLTGDSLTSARAGNPNLWT